MIHIRDACEADRATVEALTVAAYTEFATIMTPPAWAGLRGAVLDALANRDPSVERIVAEQDGTIVGSVVLYPAAMDVYNGATERVAWPEVRLLAVAPGARGQGIGMALMDECVRRARAAGATTLGLHTSRSLSAAIRLYERMGFQRAPEHDFQEPGTELVTAYRLELQPDGRK